MKIFLIVLLIFVIFNLICFIISLCVFKKAFGRAKIRASFTKPIYHKYLDGMEQGANYFRSLNPEEITIKSDDGLTLYGNLYTSKENKALVIIVHGYHGEGIYDCSMCFHFYEQKGYSIFVPDLRAHGKSEGKYLTFGIKESEDMLLWTKLLAKKFPDTNIVLQGISMGGATVGMMSDMDLPKQVKGIINDCGFTSPDEIINHVRKSSHCPYFPFQPFIRLIFKIKTGRSLKEKDASKSYMHTDLPLLFIHGGKDDFVPTEMGITNYNVAKSKHKQLVIAEDAGHALSYLVDRNKVESALNNFLDTYISK